MKDITKQFFQQPKDYGRQVNLNLTRIDMYVSKAKNIYEQLGKLQVKIMLGGTVVKQFTATWPEAADIIREYGKTYFLEIRYPNSKDALLVKLKGFVPGSGPLKLKRRELAISSRLSQNQSSLPNLQIIQLAPQLRILNLIHRIFPENHFRVIPQELLRGA